MEIRILDRDRKNYAAAIANLLGESFPHAYRDCATEEAESCLAGDRIAIVALDAG